MTISLVGVQNVSTLTLGATGGADAVGSVYAVRANAPFKNLSISVRPFDDPSPYQVDVYFDGELEETHNYTTDKNVCMMNFRTYLFPANYSTNTIPKLIAGNYPGIPILVQISNFLATTKTFEVYAIYEMYEAPQYAILPQES